MAIRTERLLLRAPALADAASISLLAGDYEVASMTGTIPHPYSEEMAVDWIQSLQAGEEGVEDQVEKVLRIGWGSETIKRQGRNAMAGSPQDGDLFFDGPAA